VPKADCCLILEGPQGIRNSTALRTLAGEFFTDELADLGSKDAAMQTRGVWIIELSELDSLSHSEVARIKAFMSRTTDRFRPPYGMRLVESPRQCVFAGTVNHSTYLRDETGARRFWPITCGCIDVDALARDRDQLWAEAKARFDAGSVWWLDSTELVQMASDEQAERYEGDPWEKVIGRWADDRSNVSIGEVLERCPQKPQALWTQSDKNRDARCLRFLGWERYRERQGARLEGDIGGRRTSCSRCSQSCSRSVPRYRQMLSMCSLCSPFPRFALSAQFSVFPFRSLGTLGTMGTQ
jgi:predicted P-loop ATPase